MFLFIPEISVVLCEIVYLFMKIFEKTKVIASHDNFCEKQIRTFDIVLCFNQNVGTRKDYIRAKEQFTKIL